MWVPPRHGFFIQLSVRTSDEEMIQFEPDMIRFSDTHNLPTLKVEIAVWNPDQVLPLQDRPTGPDLSFY